MLIAVCKGLLSPPLEAPTGSQLQGERGVGEVSRVLGRTHGEAWRICRQGSPRSSQAGYLIESTMLVVGPMSLRCPPRALATVYPSCPHPQAVQYNSVIGPEEIGVFGSLPHSWGGQLFTHTLSLFFVGEITDQEVSLGTELCCHVREGWSR